MCATARMIVKEAGMKVPTCVLVNILFSSFKVIRKFFIKHNKSFRWHLGDYEKHNFFPFEGL